MISRPCRMTPLFLGGFLLIFSSCAHVTPNPNFTNLPGDMEFPVADEGLKRVQTQPGDEGNPPTDGLPLLRYPKPQTADNPDRRNRESLLAAENTCSLGLKAQPDRLDLILELSRVEQALGLFETQYDLLAKALQKNDQQDGSFQWIPGTDLPESPQTLLSNSLLESQAFWFSQGPEKVGNVSRLARLAMTFNPQDPYAYNALAVCQQIRGNPQHALKCLLIALHRDETNCLVLGNIGRLMSYLGKRRAAKIYYRKVVALNKDSGETVEALNFLGGDR